MTLSASVNQSRQLPLATAYTRTFFMGVTGLTLTVTISKAGAAFAAAAGVVSELTLGWYKIALTTVDTGTQGDLAYHATDGGTNIEDWSDQVAGYVTLADKVTHGGVLGSSTATLALLSANFTNPSGHAFILSGGTTAGSVRGDGLHATSNYGNGVLVQGNGTAFSGMELSGYDGLSIFGGNQLIGTEENGAGLFVSGNTANVYGVYVYGLGTAEAFLIDSQDTGACLKIRQNSSGDAVVFSTTVGNTITLSPTGGVSINAPVPTTGNTANSFMDCLNAARADGFGKWAIVGTTLTLYAADGTTAVKTFTLNSATTPTSRT